MSEKKTSKKPYKRANRFAYWFLIGFIARIFLKLRLNTKFDRTGIKELIEKGGPALVVSPHTSNLDFLFAGAELYPNIVTFVGSHHFTTNKITNFFLKVAHAIPKKMFCADVSTIISIMRAKDAGQIIVIYPEGRLTCSGHSVQLTEGTAELAKKLGVSKQSVSNWENDNIQPSIEMLVKLSRIFSVSTDYLLGESDHVYLDVSSLNQRQVRHIQQIIDDIIEAKAD